MAGDAIRVIVKKNDLQLLARMAPQRAEDAILALAREGERYVKQAMQESPASGEAYPRGGRVHIASSPGNPPRIDTGTLINSISARRVGAFDGGDFNRRGLCAGIGIWHEENCTASCLDADGDVVADAREACVSKLHRLNDAWF